MGVATTELGARADTERMTTIPEARQVAGRVSPAASGPAARTLLLTGLGALSFSLLMLVAMDISTNPLPGELAFEVMAWLREVTLVMGAVLVAAAVARRVA